ncbi:MULTISPECIES: hypothetical protein [Alcanivorax]|uniref:hypothetical protein n=1 Tax=Alcanivorax TaxID=59753 RepID=UPI002409FE6E|nr:MULTISPECIES: hypothetical protein [Alcanivorax]MDF1638443.1 hypothetical protein [Alcanivorax jadensis]|tara:strand:- start:207 stop:695 length:489 start_codon:yes stop_codon:yes gene_type:complete
MSASSHPAVPRLNLLWFTVLAAPMMIGIAIALMIQFGQYQATMKVLPQDTLRMGALGAMALMLVVARPLRNLLLAPTAIAQRPLQGTTPASDDDTAAMKVQTSMFMLLGFLDTVAIIVIVLCLMQADGHLAILNGIFSLIMAIIAKPNFSALIEKTRQQLQR